MIIHSIISNNLMKSMSLAAQPYWKMVQALVLQACSDLLRKGFARSRVHPP